MRLTFGLIVTVFVALPAFGKTYLASAVQNLSGNLVQAQGHQVVMPPAYSAESKSISFCYGFTAATLINQMLYTADPVNYQAVSMLDLSLNGLGMGVSDIGQGKAMRPTPQMNDLGNPYRVLVYGALRRSVAPESCMPFDRLNLLKSSNAKRSENFQAFIMTLASAFSNKPEVRKSLEQVSSSILSLEPELGSSAAEITSILQQSKVFSYEDLTSVMAKVLIPTKCESQRLDIPVSEVSRFKVTPENRASFLTYLKTTLNRDRPLSWAFCINSACDQQHVLIVSGWRKICDADLCREQFLLRDSGEQVAAIPGDYWVDDLDILQKTDVMLEQYDALAKKDMVPNLIMNLEY